MPKNQAFPAFFKSLYHIRNDADPTDEIGSNLSMHDQLRFSTYGKLREGLLEKIKDRFSLDK